MRIGRVLSSEIEKNRDGETNVIMIRCEISDENDIQDVELFRQPGIDARPTEDTTLLLDDVGESWQVAMSADDNIEPSVEPGEIAIYAAENGAKTAQVKCKLDGTIEAGLADLKLVAIAEKVDAFIDKVEQLFSSWTPVPQDGGAALKVIAASTFANPTETVASSNLKAEE
jgi:hypothetical protein